MKNTEKKLLEIANNELFYWMDEARTDLESHNSDEEDFMSLAIWDIKKALEAAYRLGRENERKEKK